MSCFRVLFVDNGVMRAEVTGCVGCFEANACGLVWSHTLRLSGSQWITAAVWTCLSYLTPSTADMSLLAFNQVANRSHRSSVSSSMRPNRTPNPPNPDLKITTSFVQSYSMFVFLYLYDLLSSVEHKRGFFWKLDAIDFHCMVKKNQNFSKTSSFVLHWSKQVTQVWNDIRVTKWHNFIFPVNHATLASSQQQNSHTNTHSITHPAHVRTFLFYKAIIIIASP